MLCDCNMRIIFGSLGANSSLNRDGMWDGGLPVLRHVSACV